MEDHKIIYAINKVQKKFPNHIVRQYGNYVIVAQNENDFRFKACSVNKDGFYTLEQAYNLQ